MTADARKNDEVEQKKPEKKKGRIRRALGWAFVPMVNAKAWILYDSVKQGYGTVSDTVDDLFAVHESDRKESFAEAAERLNLTEKKIKEQYENFRRMTMLLLLISMAIFLYSLYFLFTGGFFGFFLAFLLTLVSLGGTFRYHFWLFQIKKRKLGCTISEWFTGTFIRRGD
jgi:intracellular multiplication protein IcmV